MSDDLTARIRVVLGTHARLSVPAREVPLHADLYQLGLTSHASVNVMLGLEDAFDVEFPEEMLRKATFSSIAAMSEALDSLGAVPA